MSCRRSGRPARAALAGALVAVMTVHAVAQDATGAREIVRPRPGAVIERAVEPGRSDHLALDVRAGEFVDLVIPAADALTVTVTDPDGSTRVRLLRGTTSDASKRLCWIAGGDGVAGLDVAAAQ